MYRNYENIENLARDVGYDVGSINTIEYKTYGYLLGRVKDLGIFEIMKYNKIPIEKNIAGSTIYKITRCNEFVAVEFGTSEKMQLAFSKYIY